MDDILDPDDRWTTEQELAQFNVFVRDASAPSSKFFLTAEPVSQTVQAYTTVDRQLPSPCASCLLAQTNLFRLALSINITSPNSVR